MPWDKTNRTKYDYKTDRYPSDMTNAQWAVIEPLVPLPKHGGRPRTTDMREVINAIFYIGRTGCQWRLLPQPFPPWTTVQRYFYEWTKTGVLAEMNDIMVASVRTAEGRFPDPTAGVIDSQSVKTTESGGVFGYDAGKKIKGRKRHIVTDTLGYLLMIHVHTANIQDRDGAVDLLKELGEKFPNLRHVFADGGYRGPKLKNAMGEEWTIQTIMRSHDEKGFVLLPRRWVVERTFAWLGRNRRLAKDWERKLEISIGWVLVANIGLMTRKLTRDCSYSKTFGSDTKSKFPSTFPPTGAGRFEPRHCAFSDQLSFKFRQGCKDTKGKPSCRSCCVNQRTLPSENLEADATLGQHADGSDKMVEVASHTVESPYDQDIALPQCL